MPPQADVTLSIILRARDLATQVIRKVGPASAVAGKTAVKSFAGIGKASAKVALRIAATATRALKAVGSAGLRAAKKVITAFAAIPAAVGSALTSLPVIIAAAAIGGIALISKALINVASDAEETRARFETVFGDITDKADAAAATIAKDFGRATQDVEASLANFQDLFVPLGLAEDDAIQLSDALTRLSLDLSSFANVSPEDALRDLQSAMVGQSETVLKYGIILNENTVKQIAWEEGIAESGKELTNQQKVLARYVGLIKSSTAAQNDAIRTQDGYANQARRLQAGIRELAVTFGQELIAAVGEASSELGGAEKVLDLVKLGMRFATEAGKGLIGVVGGIVGKAVEMVDALGGVDEAEHLVTETTGTLGLALDAVGTIAGIVWLGFKVGIVSVVTVVKVLLNFLDILGSFLGGAFLSGVAKAAEGLGFLLKTFRGIAEFIAEGLIGALDLALGSIQDFLKGAAAVAEFTGFDEFAQGARQASFAVGQVRTAVQSIEPDEAVDAAIASLARLADGAGESAEEVRERVGEAWDSLQDNVADFAAFAQENQPDLLDALDRLKDQGAELGNRASAIYNELAAGIENSVEAGAMAGGEKGGVSSAEEIEAAIKRNEDKIAAAVAAAIAAGGKEGSAGLGEGLGGGLGEGNGEGALGSLGGIGLSGEEDGPLGGTLGSGGAGEGGTPLPSPAEGEGFFAGVTQGVMDYGLALNEAGEAQSVFSLAAEGTAAVLGQTVTGLGEVAGGFIESSEKGKEAFKSLAKQVISSIVQMLLKIAILKLVGGGLFGGAGGGGPSFALGGTTSSPVEGTLSLPTSSGGGGGVPGGGGTGGSGAFFAGGFAKGGITKPPIQSFVDDAELTKRAVASSSAAGQLPSIKAFAKGGTSSGAITLLAPVSSSRSSAPKAAPSPSLFPIPTRAFAEGGTSRGAIKALVPAPSPAPAPVASSAASSAASSSPAPSRFPLPIRAFAKGGKGGGVIKSLQRVSAAAVGGLKKAAAAGFLTAFALGGTSAQASPAPAIVPSSTARSIAAPSAAAMSAVPFRAFAEGGITSGPTLALLGENPRFKGEAFVPLPDGKNIPVKFEGGRQDEQGGPVQVVFKISTVDARGFRALLTDERPLIEGMIQRAVSRRRNFRTEIGRAR